jgi:hypothetical protein
MLDGLLQTAFLRLALSSREPIQKVSGRANVC